MIFWKNLKMTHEHLNFTLFQLYICTYKTPKLRQLYFIRYVKKCGDVACFFPLSAPPLSLPPRLLPFLFHPPLLRRRPTPHPFLLLRRPPPQWLTLFQLKFFPNENEFRISFTKVITFSKFSSSSFWRDRLFQVLLATLPVHELSKQNPNNCPAIAQVHACSKAKLLKDQRRSL